MPDIVLTRLLGEAAHRHVPIMRARSGLTRRSERLESIGVPFSSRRLLDLQCSGPDAPIVTPYRSTARRLRTGGDARPLRESGFVHGCIAGLRQARAPGKFMGSQPSQFRRATILDVPRRRRPISRAMLTSSVVAAADGREEWSRRSPCRSCSRSRPRRRGPSRTACPRQRETVSRRSMPLSHEQRWNAVCPRRTA